MLFSVDAVMMSLIKLAVWAMSCGAVVGLANVPDLSLYSHDMLYYRQEEQRLREVSVHGHGVEFEFHHKEVSDDSSAGQAALQHVYGQVETPSDWSRLHPTTHVDQFFPPARQHWPVARRFKEGIQCTKRQFKAKQRMLRERVKGSPSQGTSGCHQQQCYALGEDGDYPVIFPTDFGADPTAVQDSTDAFEAAISELLSRNSAGHKLAYEIQDLGGATLDLAGGDYLISRPLRFPIWYGNFKMVSGTIRASAEFPVGETMVTVGLGGNCTVRQNACNENIGFRELMFDCNRIAGKGLEIHSTMGTSIGPQMFFLGYTDTGIWVHGGHETMIHQTWLGEFVYSDPRTHDPKYLNATSIRILGNDHFVDDTVVFSSLVGFAVRGAANLITGLHVWNLPSSSSGIGMLIDSPGDTQTRIISSYLDFNDIVAVGPEEISIMDTFFLCGGNVVLKSTKHARKILGVDIINNQFALCQNETIILDDSEAPFDVIDQVHVHSNLMSGGFLIRSSQATQELSLAKSSKFLFDFSDVLLFPQINRVEYSVTLNDSGSFALHAARPPVGNTVMVETDRPVNGTVTISVDQSTQRV